METEIYYITDTSDLDILSISPDIVEESVVANNLIPQKSKKVYEKLFEKFMEWRVRKNVTSFSENALLIYFEEMSKTMKSSTLWTHYSVLKTTLIVKHGIDISKYRKLYSLLKQKSIGYSGKKANIFSTNEIKTFIDEAPDDTYLLIKVALIFGIMGACRRHELHKLKFDDVKDLESTILVTIPNTNTNTSRAFTVTGKYYNICKKYMNLRPKKCESTSFFVNYYGGKCSVQNVGINKFGNMGKEIATYLKLPDPLSYTGHCFRRSSTTVFSGGDVTTLIRHGRSTTSGSKNNVQSPKETTTQTEREVDLTLSEDEDLSIRAAARMFSVPTGTLRGRILVAKRQNAMGMDITFRQIGHPLIFSEQQERNLVESLKEKISKGKVYTTKGIRKEAFRFAIENNVNHPWNNDVGMAGADWLRAFIKRHNDMELMKANGFFKSRREVNGLPCDEQCYLDD
ncbi:hypothetical protein C0J52_23830 [Blattella germanica]|nr:hypothetical protein C0J52_23830 [Blattella germanica]